MKLLNFANLKFKWRWGEQIRFSECFIYFKCEFKYWFYYPKSLYFGIDPDIKWIKKKLSSFHKQIQTTKKGYQK